MKDCRVSITKLPPASYAAKTYPECKRFFFNNGILLVLSISSPLERAASADKIKENPQNSRFSINQNIHSSILNINECFQNKRLFVCQTLYDGKKHYGKFLYTNSDYICILFDDCSLYRYR